LDSFIKREKMKFEIEAIATIESPFYDLVNMPIQPRGAKETLATIVIKEKYKEGLKDLNGFSHIYLIYYFHEIQEPKLLVVPFNDKSNTPRGVFSTRTPMHPNSLGLSIVELVKVEENRVTIRGVDILDGTPIIDIKPYIENFDKIEDKTKSGWMKSSKDEVTQKRSDNRFIK